MTRTRWCVAVVALVVLAAGCGSSDEADPVSSEAVPTIEATPTPVVEVDDDDAGDEGDRDDHDDAGDAGDRDNDDGDHGDGDRSDDAEADGDTDTTETAGQEEVVEGIECSFDGCPPADVLDSVEAILAAYNTGDWDTFTAAIGTAEPSWETGVGRVETIHIRADFEWSSALNQVITVDGCAGGPTRLACDLVIEDDVHRGLAALGLEPSRCRMRFTIGEDAALTIEVYEIALCFNAYDFAFHAFGEWYEQTYPEEEPIEGFHYRGWNQFGEDAPERAAAALEEFLQAAAEAEG